MVTLMRGDIFTEIAGGLVIAHQTNCRGVMGAGIALTVKRLYPAAYREYRALCGSSVPEALLGTCQIVCADAERRVYVANLFGQLSYSSASRQTTYPALGSAFERLRKFAERERVTVRFPYKIGCGLAGGDWSVVESMIRSEFGGSLLDAQIWQLP